MIILLRNISKLIVSKVVLFYWKVWIKVQASIQDGHLKKLIIIIFPRNLKFQFKSRKEYVIKTSLIFDNRKQEDSVKREDELKSLESVRILSR